jgi:hypothetical protein
MTRNVNITKQAASGSKDPISGLNPAKVGSGCEWRHLLGMSFLTKRDRQSFFNYSVA